MPSASQTIRLRRLRQGRESSPPLLKLGLVSALLISLAAVSISMVGIWFYVALTRNLPSVEILPALLAPPKGLMLQPSRLFDRDHKNVLLTLENPAAAGKQYLSLGADNMPGTSQVSNFLVDATIAELDPGFWDESGFSLEGVTEGTHPTVAQVLVSNLLLDGETPSLKRNIRERLLAAQVTAQYGRETVLEWYLNSARYGETFYGADAASRVYFGKSAADLSLAEAALLTAMAQAPSVNPLTGSQILKQNQEVIIQKMFATGLISLEEALSALKADVRLHDQTTLRGLAPAFTELVLMQLSTNIPLERIYQGGYDIVTTLDYDLQLQAGCAAQAQIARVRGIQESTVTFDGSPCQASSMVPSLQDGSVILTEEINAEVIIIEPHTGQILAMVGEGVSGMLPSTPATHPAGTALSPFMYLTAFSRGMSPATLLWDIPGENGFDTHEFVSQAMKSSSTITYHGPVSLRAAFVNDYKAAANEVLQQVGAANVRLTEKQFGIGALDLSPDDGISLTSFYSQSVSLLETVHAYSVLANQGIMTGQLDLENAADIAQNTLNPVSILKVMSVDGQVWLDWTIPHMLPVVTRQIAYLTTNVLSDEKVRLSSFGHLNSLEFDRPAAVKLSLSDDANNAWAVGYIPQLSVGVWLGTAQGNLGGITAEMPAGLWQAVIKYAATEMPLQDFSMPTGVSLVQVCTPSGLLISSLCPEVIQEVFLYGNEPTQVDNLYQKYAIDRTTGKLATVFTPSEMVEEKVFLVVPPQAKAWAADAGIEIPPDTYDSIVAPQTVSADVRISAPKLFDHVRGNIDISGSAGGVDFLYYRVQVGQGLNPQEWLQIGDDTRTPVSNGILVSWDTAGLEGLYVIQLQVIRQDSRIEQADIQVTIDNEPPEIKIQSPQADALYRYQTGMTIMVNVTSTDNFALERVEFYIDDSLDKTLQEPPYVIVWDAEPGKHSLRVKAYDLAGNQREAAIPFSVSR